MSEINQPRKNDKRENQRQYKGYLNGKSGVAVNSLLVADFLCVRKGTQVLKVECTPPYPSPISGRGEKGAVLALSTKLAITVAIEDVAVGDYVVGHDGLPHRVARASNRQYTGKMVGIKHNGSDEVLWVTADLKVLARKSLRNLGGMRDWSGIIPGNYDRAKQLRKDMTPPEKIVWEMVRGSKFGVKFRRQHPIGSYIPDFYSHEINLAIEVDGAAFHSSRSQRHRDSIRDQLLQQRLIRVVRIPAKTVFSDPSGTAKIISQACQDFFNPQNAQWITAGELKRFDLLFTLQNPLNPSPISGREEKGGVLVSSRITELYEQITEEQFFDIEVEEKIIVPESVSPAHH